MIDQLYEKVKGMTPQEYGIPLQAEASALTHQNSNAYIIKETIPEPQSKEKNISLPLRSQHSRKHPASGRFGVKSEMQKRHIKTKNCPTVKVGAAHSKNSHARLSRTNAPKKPPKRMYNPIAFQWKMV